jgi:putative ABC transport system permease protein
VFDELGAYRLDGFTLSGIDEPESISALNASSSLFRVLGVDAVIGRAFTEDEERRRDRVVVLTHEFWQRRFGGNRNVVGRSITLSGDSFVVVGVMPVNFRFPESTPIDLYSPLVFTQVDELTGRRRHTLTVIGRLKDGVTRERASANIGAIARGIAAQDSGSNPEVDVIGAHDLLVEDVRLGLVILLATVGFVLLIACTNVANLLLARATARRGEMGLRSALGAGRLRLVRQLLTESVLLALIGSVLGTLGAWWVLGLLARVSPRDFVRIDQVGIDLTVLVFATAIAAVTGLGFGIAPALQMSGSNLINATKEQRFRRHHGHSILAVSQIALSLMLLVGAGLMIRSLLQIQKLDLGFQPQNVLTASIFLPLSSYPVDPTQYRPLQPGAPPPVSSKRSAFFEQLLEKVAAVPGVQSAGAVTSLPLSPVGIDYDLPVVVQGRPRPRLGEEPQADFRVVSTDYFRTMKIPILRGREFTEFDGPAAASVVIINETMQRQVFPGEEPIGRRLLLYGRPREIIGVVGSVRHHGFSRDPRPEMILPYRQFQLGEMTLVVRSSLERFGLTNAIKKELHSIDRGLPFSRVRMMDDLLAESVAQPRFTALLLSGFAFLAVTLALVGVYGVMSYTVSQRTQEIGVRMALGAVRPAVVWMVVRHGMILVVLGIVVGLGGAAVGTRLMARLLFGVTATDPTTFIAAAGALSIASLAATYIPALRAAHVAPLISLRSE